MQPFSYTDPELDETLSVSYVNCLEFSNLNFEDCMKMEFRMVSKVMDDHDFYEGVRALIIDKDNTPVWKPETVEKISNEEIDEFFKYLEDNELKFNTR